MSLKLVTIQGFGNLSKLPFGSSRSPFRVPSARREWDYDLSSTSVTFQRLCGATNSTFKPMMVATMKARNVPNGEEILLILEVWEHSRHIGPIGKPQPVSR